MSGYTFSATCNTLSVIGTTVGAGVGIGVSVGAGGPSVGVRATVCGTAGSVAPCPHADRRSSRPAYTQ